ncbi:hypothetical protein EZV62_011479 [Acer yangbiense]|uniref:Wall-associated receptor kinase galacturonan-binding domain-containing protein n=1 Tax=Acer yangbiense TaxID=1000413 RepID=A0A5C7I5V4_9ROSI|nr:hypothetical protein EZV62_011479 [Acer yangbiense]
MVVLSPSSSLLIKPDCQKKCGEISISYPFGIGAGCYLDDSYAVNCRSGKPFLASINLELLNISLEANTILVNHPVFNTCVSAGDSMESANLENSPFFFSQTPNILFGQGCYFLAYINHNQTYAGCYSSCFLERNPTACLGIHCCHSTIPPFLQFFNASVVETDKVEECKLVFVVEEEWIVRKEWNPGNSKAVPVVLDWGIHNSSFHLLNITTSTSRSCNDFTNPTFANKSLSTSTTASNSLVHQCNCKGGFQGNPYLLQGCQDIDECKNKSICSPTMSCRNVIGSYNCNPRGPRLNTTQVILASSQKDNGNVQQDYEEVEHETHERTEITECWDVVSTSTG